jgi:hypothetical protein
MTGTQTDDPRAAVRVDPVPAPDTHSGRNRWACAGQATSERTATALVKRGPMTFCGAGRGRVTLVSASETLAGHHIPVVTCADARQDATDRGPVVSGVRCISVGPGIGGLCSAVVVVLGRSWRGGSSKMRPTRLSSPRVCRVRERRQQQRHVTVPFVGDGEGNGDLRVEGRYPLDGWAARGGWRATGDPTFRHAWWLFPVRRSTPMTFTGGAPMNRGRTEEGRTWSRRCAGSRGGGL